jgi:hypothetical protein
VKLIGLLISIAILSLLIVLWITSSLKRSKEAIQTTQEIDNVQEGTNPVQYSKDKAEEINQKSFERANELNQIP